MNPVGTRFQSTTAAAAIRTEAATQNRGRFSTLLTPLTYLGGVFYTIKLLPEWAQGLSYANPILYMVNAFRYGFLGVSDAGAAISLIVLAAMSMAMLAWAQYLFSSGHRLKP